VHVCPTGIDIRDGLQLECIGCGLCVDACNEMMDKVGFPRDLVRFDSVQNTQLRARGKEAKVRIFRPRTFYYMGIIALVGSIMLFGLLTRSVLEINILRDRQPLYVTLSDGDVRNGNCSTCCASSGSSWWARSRSTARNFPSLAILRCSKMVVCGWLLILIKSEHFEFL
jgi:polyferredoxin